MRLAVGIEYDGSAYSGWQSQATSRSVQSVLERALTAVATQPLHLVCAGRTDAGVHARWQVAHFETSAHRPLRGWVLGANSALPSDIALTWARPVPAHFHARYSAEARTYRYVILNRATRSALAARRVSWIYRPLDQQRMAQAAAQLCGRQDFSAFRSAECQSRSPIRHLEQLSVQRQDDWVVIEATANAFLHHMMRNLVGLLIAVGRGEGSESWAGEILASRDRSRAPATAPATGLYLWAVRYPAAFALPDPLPGSRSTSRSVMIS
ncbi:MAG TPA: tRNA pseudouridine(38-40) synthase TruA [Steroidobacteraceae bacterium]